MANSFAQSVSLQGQVSGWITYRDNVSTNTIMGVRYIPELRVSKSLTDKNKKTIDTEIALNCHASLPVNSSDNAEINSDIKLYRLWLRYSSSQFETRLGLQKINFGPAKILRSLMWFDEIDPQDPFEITGGVYGLLTRYYFFNDSNANIWFWGLYGNNELKGLEYVKTHKERPEFGARFQSSLLKGEMSYIYHQRYVDEEDWNINISTPLTDGIENRYAIDGNWDVGIGLWFETSLSEIKINKTQQMRNHLTTIGCDYTFAFGIHTLYEHFLQYTGPTIKQMEEATEYSTLSADYPLGIMDRINTLLHYDWTEEKFYSYLGWQRTYDNWQINLAAFSNKENIGTTFSGKGIQLIITYNY